ncbi:hypothetical protein FEM48_Zijuj03G0078000 [Ziziphus jujuba var. spinosa]|uniref:Dirigent protein n=1 Tax=Ziziphus jujuba var. spinosa TaxID=714518 RepID=A0A978VP24_ZIZJJ|nr:hypothetical protein FEM48_Zijuj03G0078000 [Ziziphus jujuba var. spinosa]
MAKTLKAISFFFFLLSLTLGCANSARILDEVEPQPQVLPSSPAVPNPVPTTVPDEEDPESNPTTTLPSGQIPATTPAIPANDDTIIGDADAPVPDTDIPDDATEAPVSNVAPPEAAPATVAPIAGPTTTSPAVPTPAGSTSSTVAAQPAGTEHHPVLSFFMHDIIGGTHPSVRVVTGIVANAVTNAPFSKPNNNFLPVSGGTPLPTSTVNGFINNNRDNLPFLAGLNNGAGFSTTQSGTLIQNSGDNNIVNGGTSQPFVTAGQLPAGSTLQKLMFGSVTVIDDELTESHELGSTVIGKAQGFYLASSLDGNSHTMVVTVLLHGGDHDHHEVEDTISFFGVHRTAAPQSQIAVIGGTGKYENAKGYAVIESILQEDQHTTDGVDTIMHTSVYLSE